MLASFFRDPLFARAGRRAFLRLGLLTGGLAALGWVAWWAIVARWPIRATFGEPHDWPLAFSADGRELLGSRTVSDIQSEVRERVTPWGTGSGLAREPWPDILTGFPKVYAASPDGRWFAIAASMQGASSAKVDLVGIADGRRRWSVEVGRSDVYAIGWTAEGRALWTCLGDSSNVRELATWDPATGEKTSSRPISAPGMMNFAAVSPDGRVLAYYSYSRWKASVELWDLGEDRSLGRLANPAKAGSAAEWQASFSGDGRILAFVVNDGSVELWDVPGRKLIRSIPYRSGWDTGRHNFFATNAIEVAPDGRTFALVASEAPDDSRLARIWRDLTGWGEEPDSELIVVDIATGRTIARGKTTFPPVYSPDSQAIATRDKGGIHVRGVPPSPR